MLAFDDQHHPPPGKLYSYNTSTEEIQNSMFRTPIDGFFPDFLWAQNMVRVIEGKII